MSKIPSGLYMLLSDGLLSKDPFSITPLEDIEIDDLQYYKWTQRDIIEYRRSLVNAIDAILMLVGKDPQKINMGVSGAIMEILGRKVESELNYISNWFTDLEVETRVNPINEKQLEIELVKARLKAANRR